MKTLISSVIALAISFSAYALPVFNPSDATLLTHGLCWDNYCTDPCSSICDKFSFRIGFYGDYIFNRQLQNKSANDKAGLIDTEIMTNAGLLALGFSDMVDVFVSLGATNISQTGQNYAYGIPGFSSGMEVSYFETNTDFSWSVGASATLWEWRCISFGAEGQYFSTRPNLNSFRREGQEVDYSVQGTSVHYQDWQVALGAAYRVNIMSCNTAAIPYAAVRWGGASLDANDARSDLYDLAIFDQEASRSWGWAFGLTLVGCDWWSVTAEGRFASEKALHLNTQVRF